MSDERSKYYNKVVGLLLSVFKELRGDSSLIRGESLSDRKNKILIKEYGSSFSRENVLFMDNFLLFAPSFVVTYDSLRSWSLNEEVAHNRIIHFKDIKEIRYNLMPCQTAIHIKTGKSGFKELYDGVPTGETYTAIKTYEESVQTGYYKTYTICLLSCLYALTSMYRCKPNEYESTFLRVEQNLKRLIKYQKELTDYTKKYGGFFSFDFVSCEYDPNAVARALDKITSVKLEVREEERAERKEQFVRSLERKMDEARQQYERQHKE